jgi:hypothetical protein
LSANFYHLKKISPELHRLAVLAGRFFTEDANTSLIKSRQFGGYMVKEIVALSASYDPDPSIRTGCCVFDSLFSKTWRSAPQTTLDVRQTRRIF